MLEMPSQNEASRIARRAMIDSQLRTSGVTAEHVIGRMLTVPREDFVPASMRSAAYIDRAVSLGDGRFLAAPLFHGMMLQEAAPRGTEQALVVDGGSRYLPELLRPLVATLTVITPEEALSTGSDQAADLLLIDGAVEHVPDVLAARLSSAGLLLTGFVDGGVTKLARGRRSGSGVALLPLAELGIPRLPQFDKPKGWSF